jgi:hypothetical protein
MGVSFAAIPVGSRWSRPRLAMQWGYAGYQALARGVVTPAATNLLIFFVTEEKQSSSVQYADRVVDGKLHWEGPTDHFAQERIFNADRDGDVLHLFHRRRHHSEFVYRGLLALTHWELRADSPSLFTFDLAACARHHLKNQ